MSSRIVRALGPITVEHALTIGDFKQRLVEGARGIANSWQVLLFAIEVGNRAIDRIDALLHFDLGGASFRDQLIDTTIESGDSLGQLPRWLRVSRLAARGARSVRAAGFGQSVELSGRNVEPIIDLHEAVIGCAPATGAVGTFAVRKRKTFRRCGRGCCTAVIVAAWLRVGVQGIVANRRMLVLVVIWVPASLRRLSFMISILALEAMGSGLPRMRRGGRFAPRRVENHAIEPLAQRHASAAGRLQRGGARLSSDPLNVPWNAGFHAAIAFEQESEAR
jgi:hypothetical protein